MSTNSVTGTNGTGKRNRSWPEALKREIEAASFAPGSSVSKVARHYDVNGNQVFGWRKRYRDEAAAPGAWHEFRLRVRAPHRTLRCMGNLFRIGLPVCFQRIV